MDGLFVGGTYTEIGERLCSHQNNKWHNIVFEPILSIASEHSVKISSLCSKRKSMHSHTYTQMHTNTNAIAIPQCGEKASEKEGESTAHEQYQ